MWVRGNSAATWKCARLDQALCNMEWRIHFQEGAVQRLLQNYSDHSLLLIGTRGFASIPGKSKHFRFQVAWTSHADFDKELQSHWKHDVRIMPALHNLSEGLTKWNKEVIGNLFRRKLRYGPASKLSKLVWALEETVILSNWKLG